MVLRDSSGCLDVENQVPVQDDTIVRIYSMSKPIACAAALICYELGHFEMEQPVELYLPEFKGMQVWNAETGELEPCRRRMNIKRWIVSAETKRALRGAAAAMQLPSKCRRR